MVPHAWIALASCPIVFKWYMWYLKMIKKKTAFFGVFWFIMVGTTFLYGTCGVISTCLVLICFFFLSSSISMPNLLKFYGSSLICFLFGFSLYSFNWYYFIWIILFLISSSFIFLIFQIWPLFLFIYFN